MIQRFFLFILFIVTIVGIPVDRAIAIELSDCIAQVQNAGSRGCIIGRSAAIEEQTDETQVEDSNITELGFDMNSLETERQVAEARYEMALRAKNSPYTRPEMIAPFIEARNDFLQARTMKCGKVSGKKEYEQCYMEFTKYYILRVSDMYKSLSQ